MTKLFAFIAVILCVATCVAYPATAYAETEYAWARIEKDSVNLYADEDCTKTLFRLEKSYYVEILQTLDRVYMVTVMQSKGGFLPILGYVRKIEVKPVEVTPLSPTYPTVQIHVTGDSAQLKLLPLVSSETVIVATTTQKLNYYGKLTYYGKDWYYVYCGGKFGYVDVDVTSKPLIEPHPTPLETAKPVVNPNPSDGDEPTTDTPAAKTPAAEIVLIVFVVLLAGGLTLALFLPGNAKKNDVFEQDI